MKRISFKLLSGITLTMLAALTLTASVFGQINYLEGSENPNSPGIVSSDGFGGLARVHPTKPKKVQYYVFKAGDDVSYIIDVTPVSATSANSLKIEFLDRNGQILTTDTQFIRSPIKVEGRTRQLKLYSNREQNILIRVTTVLLDRDGNPREPAPTETRHDVDEETASVSSIDYKPSEIKYRLKFGNNGLMVANPNSNTKQESPFQTSRVGGERKP